jgi:3-oxoadipate enol-lactonase
MEMTRLDPTSIVLHASGSGSPVVLLHCLGVDHHFWDFASELKGEFRLLRYDLPGHGATPVPDAPYTIEDLSHQLAQILKAAGVAKAHVAGISMGGLIAQHFAAGYAAMVDRLILIDTTPRYTDDLRRMWAVRAKTARNEGVKALVDGLLPIWFSPECIAQNAPAVCYVRDVFARASGEGYALACEALAAADLRAGASSIKAPTLVICGDNDIPSFLDAARWLSDNIAHAQLSWIAGARHASVIEKPQPARELMRAFLR